MESAGKRKEERERERERGRVRHTAKVRVRERTRQCEDVDTTDFPAKVFEEFARRLRRWGRNIWKVDGKVERETKRREVNKV